MTSNLKSIISVAEELYEQEIFRLTLSSNELFHSNILQYMAERLASADGNKLSPGSISKEAFCELAKLVLPDRDAQSLETYLNCQCVDAEFTVLREKDDMDLVVEMCQVIDKKMVKTSVFAIEVKVKAYPKMEQLKGYVEELHPPIDWPEIPRLVLVTLTGAENIKKDLSGENSIGVCSFQELTKKLSCLQDQLQNSPLLLQYQELCCKLARFAKCIETALNEGTSLKCINGITKELEPYRLHSVWQKLVAEKIALLSRCKLESVVGGSLKEYLKTYVEYSDTGTAGIVLAKQKDNSNDTVNVGVQIAGKDFRLCLDVAGCGLATQQNRRKQVEKALICLFKQGLFKKNPRALKFLRILNNSNSECPTSLAANRQHPVFDCQTGKPKDKKTFTLNGYNNKDGGFADLRLKLRDSVTLKEIACEVSKVLRGEYDEKVGSQSRLLDLVKGFEKSQCPKAWFKSLSEN